MKKYFLLLMLAVGAFMSTYNGVGHAFPPGGILGRGQWEGYHTGIYSAAGDNVFPVWYDNCAPSGCYEAMPNMGSAGEFIGFIKSYLYSGDTRLTSGASFIIYTMLGWWSWNNGGAPPPAWIVAQWENMVNTAQATGHVSWRANFTFNTNSAYQYFIGDDAFFDQGSWRTDPAILFYAADGQPTYGIRWACGNPILQEGDNFISQPWDVTGDVTVSDSAPNPGDTATSITTTAGDTLHFNDYLTNNGPGYAATTYGIFGHPEPNASPWLASYFSNPNLTGSPTSSGIIPRIYSDFGYGSPPGLPADGFSIRYFQSEYFTAGTYTFDAVTDDGVRVFVDGVQKVNDWNSHAPTQNTFSMNMTAGNHTIIVEYFEGGGPGYVYFYYYQLLQGSTAVPGGAIAPGERRPVKSENVPVPAAATPGTKICRRVWWNWKNSWGAGDFGYGAAGISPPACATVGSSFNLTAQTVLTITNPGGGSPPDNYAEAGDTVTFTYRVNNSLSGTSSGTTCTISGLSRAGYYTPTAGDVSDPGFVQPAHGCPRNFGPGQTTLVTENVPAASLTPNRTICRWLTVDPATPGGGPNTSTKSCVYVAAKPYARVYGGDISAGNGLISSTGSCTPNPNAAVVGWNRGTPTWVGAGAQYAVYAMNRIQDTSTALGLAAGGAPAPGGLAFANTVNNTATGYMGGNFGFVPCIPDYFAGVTATQPMVFSFGAMTSGSYSTIGPVTIGGGNILPGTRTTVYVDGDLYISGNVIYSGSFTSATIPALRVIVRGNIYIDNDVFQLDGLYIAQRNAANTAGGLIYTCTTGAAAFEPSDPSFYGQCDNQKLTVHGALIGHQMRLGRTVGTVSQTGPAEEVDYGPIMWIPQFDAPGKSSYDAITTLPPVL